MNNFSVFIFLMMNVFVLGQNYKVTYEQYFEGKLQESRGKTLVYASPQESYIVNEQAINKTMEYPYEIYKINNQAATVYSYGFLGDNKTISNIDEKQIGNQKFTYSEETKKILGYHCKKAIAHINSNTIEIWYTQDIKNIMGSPSLLGQKLGLVLEITRNGSHTTRAVAVKKEKNNPVTALIKENTPVLDNISYRDEIWKSRFTTIPVFDSVQINFVKDVPTDPIIKKYAHGTVAIRKVKFPKISNEQQVFAELKQFSNGDAYDRTGSVFVIPQNKEKSFLDALEKGIDSVPNFSYNGKTYKGMVATADYTPALELMRFFTSFGIKKFNHITLKGKKWHNETPYRQDITELADELSEKELWVGVYIGNYDSGGHIVSLDITIHNKGKKNWNNNKVIPLFNTVNLMESAGQGYATLFENKEGLMVKFRLDKPLKNSRLRYISTGHGGWENGDEFVPKENSFYLDGKKIYSFTPWRTDCGSYRLFNPASGNFHNGLSSSDYSRSNWCPGTLTTPMYIDLGNLSAGEHTLKLVIPQGEPEGSSFSYWSTSGVVIGEE
ncbi:MAG: GLPGLI family protein [Bergeyella zoohelcum]|nr:GLPGLI family protein [Bergeyella zoohelcum]